MNGKQVFDFLQASMEAEENKPNSRFQVPQFNGRPIDQNAINWDYAHKLKKTQLEKMLKKA